MNSPYSIIETMENKIVTHEIIAINKIKELDVTNYSITSKKIDNSLLHKSMMNINKKRLLHLQIREHNLQLLNNTNHNDNNYGSYRELRQGCNFPTLHRRNNYEITHTPLGVCNRNSGMRGIVRP